MLEKEKIALTKVEKREIKKAIKRANVSEKKSKSAQETIPFERMFQDGICRVNANLYTKTIEFADTNYKIAQNEDKAIIFEGWCDLLNYFDHTIPFQFSFVNTPINPKEYENSIRIAGKNDAFDSIRTEYAHMLQSQFSRGNNGLIKNKYLTFGIKALNYKVAKSRLERIENDLWNIFKKLGVSVSLLNGKERLKVFHEILKLGGEEIFRFDWKWMVPSGLSVKDYIVPSSFTFKERAVFGTGSRCGTVSFLQVLAPTLNDEVLSDFLEMEHNLVVNMHIQSLDQLEAMKNIKRKLTDLQRMTIDEQKKAVREGYDMDIIPTDLATYGVAANQIITDLQSKNERMFLLTFTLVVGANDKKQLDNILLQARGIANQHNCHLMNLDYQQEEGFMSSLPLGNNSIDIYRTLTTSSTAIFLPFTTKELLQRNGEALYYGLNALSNNLIMVDRKALNNPSGLILGTPGSGKSFSAKREITNVFLITNDDIIICDPESEYFSLVKRLEGQVVKISPTSKQYINPMDININYSEDDNPLALKSDFILSLCELIVGGKEGLSPIEKSIIDRCVTLVYQNYLANPVPENMPILGDLYDVLSHQEEKEAKHIKASLEIYITGSLNVFNHQTNVDIQNRLVCFDIKDLGNQLKKLGMLIVQDQVWNRVTRNRAMKRSTRYYMDEFHLLLKEEQTAAYSVEIWKRFRKWGGIPTGITQNIKDLLASREIENIFDNSDFVYLLNQAPGDKEILARQLHISQDQLAYITGSGPGEGLIVYGNTIIPFIDKFPEDTELYHIMTTKFNESK